MRTLLLTMMLIVALIAVAVPICRAAECGMSSGAMSSRTTPAFRMICNTATMVARAVEGALPANASMLLVALVAVLALAMLPLAPRLVPLGLPLLASEPPGPPLDPCGVRLLI